MSSAGPDNRQKILACALRLFSAQGYDGVGIQEVVDGASVTKPTLYHYFGSKLGLLEVLVSEHFEPFAEDLRSAADYEHDLTATLNRVVRVIFAFAEQDKAFYRLQLSMWFAPLQSEAFEVVSRYHAWQFALLEGVFRRAGEDHGNMKGRHRAHAAAFLGMTDSYVGLFLNGSATLDETRARQAVHHFMHGIFS
jgi:TetR/AcrR family transcriptional regulator